MQDKLRDYIDALFEDAPKTVKTIEVKEEILQNLIDKYNDFINEGKSPEAAYNIAVASVGDISELVDELKSGSKAKKPEGYEEAMEAEQKKSALLTAVAIAMYILCVVPLFIFNSSLGVIFMFVLAAGATGLIIYNNMTKTKLTKEDSTMAEEFKEWRESNSDRKQVHKAIASAVWALTLVVYFVVSFTTHAWHITWIIFLIAVAINAVIKAVYDLRRR